MYRTSNKLYNFTKRVRRINIDHSVTVYKKALEYVNRKFGENSGDLNLVFVALIDSKQKYTNPSAKYPNLNVEINSLLRSFNKKKANILMQNRYFSTLLFYYLQKPECEKEIIKMHSNLEIRKAYLRKVEELRKTCAEVLGR